LRGPPSTRQLGPPTRIRQACPKWRPLAKASASEAGREVTGSAIQVHGGVGFTWEADVHWMFKRAQLDAQLFGGPSAQRRVLGKLLAGEAAQLAASP